MSTLQELLDSLAPSVLVELESRAGASDADREAWLAERAQGVTATELTKIMLASNRDVAIADLVKQKREGDSFQGNAYTEWGKEREPIIAADLAARFGMIPESRVFHSAVNPRYLASPDGISIDFDERLILDEIKTTGKPLPKGSRMLAEKGYEWQMQWNCFVLGAVGCWLNVELRDGTPRTGFWPGERSREWFPRDEAMIAQLVEVADRVLAAMDAGPAASVIDEQVDTNAVNYLRALDEEKRWTALKKSTYADLVAAGVSQESAIARVTFTPGTPDQELVEEVVDLEAAEAAHPKEAAALKRAIRRVEKLQAEFDELARAYTKAVSTVVKGKPARVTVTPVKAKEKK